MGYILVGLLLLTGCGGEEAERAATEPPTATPTAQAATPSPPVESATVPALALQRQLDEFLEPVPSKRSPQTLELLSMPIAPADIPTIDGVAQESVWARAPITQTLDFASQRPITLQSAHTSEQIFFRVTYPDAAPSETHKSWGWDPQEAIYKPLPDREDMFVFKWSLVGNTVHLGLRDAEPHRADIWFWKAHRTNPVGYADDKWQVVSAEPHPKAKELTSATHGALFFRRLGDAGRSAYGEKRFYEYERAVLPKYYPRPPQGSRADIRAKGGWADGQWTIEWARKLQTGHDDDVALIPGQTYLFAVSCYEMAGDQVHAHWFQPLYRAGDVFDRLLLRLAKKDAS